MKIYLSEISDRGKELSFTQDDNWVLHTTETIDEVSETPEEFLFSPQHPQHPHPKNCPRHNQNPRKIEVYFYLRKVDQVIVASGKIETFLRLICSRCTNLFEMPCQPRFSALFCKDPVIAGVAHLKTSGKPSGQNQGRNLVRGMKTPRQKSLASPLVSYDDQDLDITYLSQDYIDLKDILQEQLQLQIPFQPLCDTHCKGICPECGIDLNLDSCSCSKASEETLLPHFKEQNLST